MSGAQWILRLAAIAAAVPAGPALADAGAQPAITPYADIRYRLELVDQDGLPNDATASTLRVRAGLKAGEWHGLSALVESEAIVRLGPRDYNDTVNGRADYPVVADPSDVLLNQAYVRWRPDPAFEAIAGRQAVNLDNQRWVGSVGWRQNDQTLDAVRADVRPAAGLSATYLYAWRVNRVFGPDSPQGIWRDTDIHGARVGYAIKSVGTLSAYGYWLDIPDAPASSSKTFGVRFAGERPVGKLKLLYAAEYARQRDHAGNPADFALDYLLVEPGIATGPATIRLGIERLEGNGVAALQTPLATLHAFNGWADKFLTTPARGLRDLYADVSYKVPGKSWVGGTLLRAVYHAFDPTEGSGSYGDEIDLLVSRPIGKAFTATAKYARYNADGFATDTDKFWLQFEARF